MSATFPKMAPEWTVDEQQDSYIFRRFYEVVLWSELSDQTLSVSEVRSCR